MRIKSGTTDQYIYFVAVDETDLATRETGLSSFTVYRSRDGGAAVAMTTPTINEVDAVNMPGVYELLIDEDTTMAADNDTEAMALHITHAGMAPVTTQVELFRTNMDAISGDSAAADNLEAMFDGTGYEDDAAPSTQSQVGQLAVGSASISTVADSYVLTTGTLLSGTVADTETVNKVYQQHEDDAGTLDLYYEFDVGGNGVASEVEIIGRVNGGNDDLTAYAWDWSSSTWDAIGSYDGKSGSADVTNIYSLLFRHTGTGANLGKVRVRLEGTGLSNADLYIDQIFISYAVVNQSVGYEGGAVHVDTNGGTAGTESYVNGTADNPVLTWADALTIASNVGLSRFIMTNGSVITLTGNTDNMSLSGRNWTLNLNGQSINETCIMGAAISGISTGNSVHISDCRIQTCTLGTFWASDCRFEGTLTFASAGSMFLQSCFSETGTLPVIDLGAAVGAQVVCLTPLAGGVEVHNIKAGDLVHVEGTGEIVLDSSCTGGTLEYAGNFRITDNSAGTTVIGDDNSEAIITMPVDVWGAATSQMRKATAFNNFEFLMTDSTSHAPVTGLSVSGQISKDGGGFVSLTNAVSEVGSGMYKVNLTATELDATMVTLRFTAASADDQLIGIVLQP